MLVLSVVAETLSVIRDEHDDGAVVEAALLQVRQEMADRRVGRRDLAVVGVRRVFLLVRRRRTIWVMRIVQMHPEKKLLAGILGQPIQRDAPRPCLGRHPGERHALAHERMFCVALLRPESRTFALAYQLALMEFRPLLAQMLEAAGCDLLTISPELLKELENAEGTVKRELDPVTARGSKEPRLRLEDKSFRWMHNEDPMATEKLAEGIRKFNSDAHRLQQFALARVAETIG